MRAIAFYDISYYIIRFLFLFLLAKDISETPNKHMKLARKNKLIIVTGSSSGIGAAMANVRFAYRCWLVAIVLPLTIALAAGCSSAKTGVNIRLMTPVLSNHQASSIEADNWHQRFGADGWYRPPSSPSYQIVH